MERQISWIVPPEIFNIIFPANSNSQLLLHDSCLLHMARFLYSLQKATLQRQNAFENFIGKTERCSEFVKQGIAYDLNISQTQVQHLSFCFTLNPISFIESALCNITNENITQNDKQLTALSKMKPFQKLNLNLYSLAFNMQANVRMSNLHEEQVSTVALIYLREGPHFKTNLGDFDKKLLMLWILNSMYIKLAIRRNQKSLKKIYRY